MTDSEIDAMEAGPELDAEIAVTFDGAYWKAHPDPTITSPIVREMLFARNGQCIAAKIMSRLDRLPGLPKFSTDIAAAWTVVEKFMPMRMTNENVVRIMIGYPYIQCVIGDYEGWSNTVEKAICRAALKAMMHSKPESPVKT